MLTIAGGIILGWLGIVVLRALFTSEPTPRRQVAAAPARLSIGEFDREAGKEFTSGEARRNLMGLGFFIAGKACLERKSFDDAFDEVQRTMPSESALESVTTRTMVMLYAIDTLPFSTWKDAQAEMQAVPDAEFEKQIRSWQDARLQPYFGWTMHQFKGLSELSSFQAFVVLADQWMLGIRTLPPTWWK